MSIIPSFSSISKLSAYTDAKWKKENENLFEKYKDLYGYDDGDLKMLSYRNLTS